MDIMMSCITYTLKNNCQDNFRIIYVELLFVNTNHHYPKKYQLLAVWLMKKRFNIICESLNVGSLSVAYHCRKNRDQSKSILKAVIFYSSFPWNYSSIIHNKDVKNRIFFINLKIIEDVSARNVLLTIARAISDFRWVLRIKIMKTNINKKLQKTYVSTSIAINLLPP